MESIEMDTYGDAKGTAIAMYQAAILGAAKMMKEGNFEGARDALNVATGNAYDALKNEAIRRKASEG